LLISVAPRAALEIVQTISGKNQVCVPINKSRQNNLPASIDNVRTARLVLDFAAMPDGFDYAVTYQHSAIPNDCQVRQFAPHTWLPGTGHGD
jgi:hypothetical protein